MNNLILLIVTPILFWISSTCLFFVFHDKQCPTNIYLIPLILVGLSSLIVFSFISSKSSSALTMPFNNKDYLLLSLFVITFISGQWLSLYIMNHSTAISSSVMSG